MIGLPPESVTRMAPPTGIASTLASDPAPAPEPPGDAERPGARDGVVALVPAPQAASGPTPPTATAATPAVRNTVRRVSSVAPIVLSRARAARTGPMSS